MFATTPEWFINRDILNSNLISIGYGEDANLQNAIAIAKADISSQIISNVKSNVSITQADHNGVITQDSLQQNSVSSESILEDSQVIKQSYQDGRWYVAVEYENIPPIKRFVKKIGLIKNPERQNPYFAHTYLGQDINQITNNTLNIKLYHMSNSWYLNFNNLYQKIDINIPDLFITFSTNESNRLDIEKKSRFERIINDGEDIHFHPISKKRYWTLFAMSPEGEVYVIEDNMPINMKPGTFNFVKKTGDIDRPTMFVAVFSNSRIDSSYFRLMNGYESLDTYKNDRVRFDKFINFLEDKEFVAKKMVVK